MTDWLTEKKSSSKFAENWLRWSSGQINFEYFGKFELFVGKLEKIQKWSWKIGNFLDFFFKIPLLERPFFWKNKNFWNFAHLNFRINKCAEFWKIWDFFKIFWKKFTKFFEKSEFFSKKKFLWFCWKLAQMIFRVNKFR